MKIRERNYIRTDFIIERERERERERVGVVEEPVIGLNNYHRPISLVTDTQNNLKEQEKNKSLLIFW